MKRAPERQVSRDGTSSSNQTVDQREKRSREQQGCRHDDSPPDRISLNRLSEYNPVSLEFLSILPPRNVMGSRKHDNSDGQDVLTVETGYKELSSMLIPPPPFTYPVVTSSDF
jgi:hypothetical protein